MYPHNKLRSCFLAFAVIAVLSLACGEDQQPVNPEPTYTVETHVIRDIDFVKNRYFYFDDPLAVNAATTYPRPDDPFIPIEIWREIAPAQKMDPTVDWEPAFAFPDPNGRGSTLRDARDAYQNQLPRIDWPAQMMADFELLREGDDYQLIFGPSHWMVEGFVLKQPVEEDKALTVSYVNNLGDTIGGSFWWRIPRGPGAAERDTLLLELVKPKVQRPTGTFGSTWSYMMRNVYDLGVKWMTPSTVELVIEDRLSARDDNTYPEGANPAVQYLRIFGLDQFNDAGDAIPDGKLDFVPEVLDPSTGLLRFPCITAFAPDTLLVDEWTDHQFNFFPDYSTQYEKSLKLYHEYLTNPDFEAHQYDIIVRIKRFD